jgi:hypothetical protein
MSIEKELAADSRGQTRIGQKGKISVRNRADRIGTKETDWKLRSAYSNRVLFLIRVCPRESAANSFSTGGVSAARRESVCNDAARDNR